MLCGGLLCLCDLFWWVLFGWWLFAVLVNSVAFIDSLFLVYDLCEQLGVAFTFVLDVCLLLVGLVSLL